eukprot:gene10342-12094_t
MQYACTEYVLDGVTKRKERNFRLNGNSFDTDFFNENEAESSALHNVSQILKRTFLPVGYPNSVRPEYITYQFWDSVQGMSSYLRSVLTTRSVLAGAGVGSLQSTALAAALTWVFRDGIGMIGSLVFAYYFANAFEIYIKEWRYLADVLNNVGLTLDLVSSYFPRYYFALTSISTLCKSCCGLIAGATKARISAHFAMPGHLADVTAKESTQETAVALSGLVLGMALARLIGDDDVSVWITFTVLLCLHQHSNYQLVRVLVFDTLNPQRCWIIAQQAALPSPREVSTHESFLRPFHLTYFGPEIGGSIRSIADTIQFIVCCRSGTFIDQSGWHVARESRPEEVYASTRADGVKNSIIYKNVCAFFDTLVNAWPGEPFVVGVNRNGRVIVSLHEHITTQGLCKAYLMGYYVHRKLNCKIALYNASNESKQAYLTEVYEYLTSTVAKEALLWYDSLHIESADSRTQAKEASLAKKDGIKSEATSNTWNLFDTSSLYVAPWRYQDMEKTESQ